MNPPAPGTFVLDQFQHDCRIFILKEPITCMCSHGEPLDPEYEGENDGVWCYEYAPLNLLGYSFDQQEAWDSFHKDFAIVWDEIAELYFGKLTDKEQSVKVLLEKMVKTVKIDENKVLIGNICILSK